MAVALGPQRGAEVLTRHLNSVYSPLIASVEQYCGSVVGFSGDAITYWFEQDTGRRATFLDNVPAHRVLVAAWRQHLDDEQEAA